MVGLQVPVVYAGECRCNEGPDPNNAFYPCLDSPLVCAKYCKENYGSPAHQWGSKPCPDVCKNLPENERFQLLSCKKMDGGRWLKVKIKCTTDMNRGKCYSLACRNNGNICNKNKYELDHGLSQWNVGKHCRKPSKIDVKCP